MRNCILNVLVTMLLLLANLVTATPECRYFYSAKDLSLAESSAAIQVSNRGDYIFKLMKFGELLETSSDFKTIQSFLDTIFIKNLEELRKNDYFVELIRRTNHELRNQMHVLLMFEGKTPDRVVAGATFVVVNTESQLMAFQLELPSIKVDTIGSAGYPISEIARVGVDTDTSNASVKFKLLIDTVFDVAMTSKNIKTFYAFTSRRHQGLYRRFGYNMSAIARPETHPQLAEKDLILEAHLSR